jgi:two-component system LytT family response regulator
MIRTVIADDEEHARRGIANRLAALPEFAVVAACGNGSETAEAIQREKPDLVFLDIQMPGKTGFEVIEAVGADNCPLIVFVTAYDAFAMRAFEVHALDYLLKPVDDARFDDAIGRVREAIEHRRTGDFRRKLASLLEATAREPSAEPADRFIIRSGGRIVFVVIDEIDWVAATGDYVTVHADKKSWLTRETMADMQRQLEPRGFVRIHRSTIVNRTRIAELRYLDSGDYRVMLRDGTELKMSRNYQSALKELLGSVS